MPVLRNYQLYIIQLSIPSSTTSTLIIVRSTTTEYCSGTQWVHIFGFGISESARRSGRRVRLPFVVTGIGLAISTSTEYRVHKPIYSVYTYKLSTPYSIYPYLSTLRYICSTLHSARLWNTHLWSNFSFRRSYPRKLTGSRQSCSLPVLVSDAFGLRWKFLCKKVCRVGMPGVYRVYFYFYLYLVVDLFFIWLV